MDFDINESLKLYLSDPTSIQTADAAPEIVDADHDVDSLSPSALSEVLEPIRDSIHENPDALLRSANFDTLQCLLKLSSSIPGPITGKILEIVTSGLLNEADTANQDVENDEQETISHHKQLLEMYAFLLQWSISAVETKAAEKPAAPARKGPKGTKKAATKDGSWDSAGQVQTAMDVMCKVMKLKLNRIFATTSDRDTFINLFTRSTYLIMESEARMKVTSIRMFCFKVICIAIKHNGHALGAQTSIIQNLTYFEHLSEPMAELLHILSEQYDFAQLSSEVLRELAAKEFNPTDAKGPKAVSTFITKLSELEPRLVGRELGQLAKFLDSEAYTLRCAIIEVCGNLLADLSKQDEQDENIPVQINAFFDVLEQRFLDTNPYCRCRAIQVFMKVCSLEQKYPKRRQAATELAVQSLQDRSSNVRRNAVKLLGKLVSTHPFSAMHGGELSMTEWEGRLQAIEEQINTLQPPPEEAVAVTAEGEEAVDSGLLDEVTQMQEESKELTDEEREKAMQQAERDAATAEVVAKLKLTRKYYNEALKFIEVIHEAADITCQLLLAKNKSEVIEAMDFFVVIDAYKVECARKGIRRMLRLIWTKGNNDEGKGVQSHLIDCYKGLFFDAPDSFNLNDAANFIARNMISLTFNASPAELTSLEQLLATMMTAGHISQLVISKLWQVYGVGREISKGQRRGAIIVLGMIATADPQIVIRELETMLRVGLGPTGRKDPVLARWTCLALKRMIPPAKKAQDKARKEGMLRMPNDQPVLRMLASILLVPSTGQEWYGMAEQAISAIYVLSEHPDVLCSEVLRIKTRKVFSQVQSQQSISRTPSPEPEQEKESDAMDVDNPAEITNDSITTQPQTQPEAQTELEQNKKDDALALSQLLFVVGHVAIKQIVHLELCELDFKRRKQEQEKDKPVAPENTQPTPAARRKKGAQQLEVPKEDERDELDMIGGTTEDDFTEAITHIRDHELLYGRRSILAMFGPIVTEICANNTLYRSRTLQSQATLCLAKLMCVSSEYCERNLPLLITILERSPDPIVRSNAVIALGDMAVCFNHLIDSNSNTDFLYRRLQDSEDSVKRTCLMTLTFLILAGQVKVKGQLGEMAKCLEDSDRKISDLARMFFTELATKDNAVYNQFVDMFSILTRTGGIEGGVMEEEALKRVLKFLCGFIEKDKHAKNLAEKLGGRLGRCENERQWNDTAFALGLLGYGKSEELERRVKEGYRVVDAAAA